MCVHVSMGTYCVYTFIHISFLYILLSSIYINYWNLVYIYICIACLPHFSIVCLPVQWSCRVLYHRLNSWQRCEYSPSTNCCNCCLDCCLPLIVFIQTNFSTYLRHLNGMLTSKTKHLITFYHCTCAPCNRVFTARHRSCPHSVVWVRICLKFDESQRGLHSIMTHLQLSILACFGSTEKKSEVSSSQNGGLSVTTTKGGSWPACGKQTSHFAFSYVVVQCCHYQRSVAVSIESLGFASCRRLR